jgi:hypothetical protein
VAHWQRQAAAAAVATLSLAGDAVHNLLDGMVIVAAYSAG